MVWIQPPHREFHTANCWKHRLLREEWFYFFAIFYTVFQAPTLDHCLWLNQVCPLFSMCPLLLCWFYVGIMLGLFSRKTGFLLSWLPAYSPPTASYRTDALVQTPQRYTSHTFTVCISTLACFIHSSISMALYCILQLSGLHYSKRYANALCNVSL